MLSFGSQDVALLCHAGTTCISRDHVLGLTLRRANCLGITELFLKFGVSFAALAIDTSPDRGIISARAAI
jgi:hypothetical protein